ncbi:MAG: DUF3078 domain-containing protein [Chitinophagaceae bacterium]
MKKITAFIFFLSVSQLVFSQDEIIKRLRTDAQRVIKKEKDADTSTKAWKRGGIYGINVSQGSLSNWAAGGDNFSLSVNSLLSLFAFYKKGHHSWDNTFDLNLGYVKTTTLGSRKNDDRFDMLSKYGHALNPKLNIATLFNLRSQVFRGYLYSDSSKVYASNFMAPGYVLVSAGLDYKPVKNLSAYISPVTARWVIVRDSALSNKGLYGVPPGKKSTLEFGGFATIGYFIEFNKHISFKSRLDLFSNYRHNPENIDIFMSNVLNAKLGKIFAITWSVDVIYDDDVRLFGPYKNAPATQLKSLVGIGFQVKF